MNGNDLMDALSGIDPKFIEEAAFELNAKPVQEQRREKASVKRGFFIALPIAAAAILTIAVAYPFLMRISKTGSSSPSLSDSASYAPAEEAASEMPVQAEAEAQNEAMDSAALAPAEDAVSEMPAQAEITGSAAQEAAKENARDSRPFTLSSASYTIETADGSDVRTIYGEGTLGSVMISEDPLILDLTGLDLRSGTYILTIADESVEFDV